MNSRLKLAILISWPEEGNWLLPRCLERQGQAVEILRPISFTSPFSGRLNRLSNYLSEFYNPIRALIQRNRFDLVVSWHMRIGICYGILKRIIHPRKPPLHIIQDFHINLARTDGPYRLKLALLRLAIPGIDYFFCTSTEEEAIYSEMFAIPRNRIAFLPLVQFLPDFKEPSSPPNGYIFSFGRSDRDFDTLIRSVTPLGIKTYILSGKYEPRVPVPEHVCIIREHVSDTQMVQWIAASQIVVLSLKDSRISAGQISMLEVMSLGRPLIITDNMATREYAVHRHSALFFRAGSDTELTDHIRYLWSHRESAEEMGRQARETLMPLNDKHVAVFTDMLERCAMDVAAGRRHQPVGRM